MKTSRLRLMAQYLLLILALGSLIPAVLFFLGGILGLVGILADVGPAENRQFGLQAMGLSLLFFVLAGGAFLPAAILYRNSTGK